MDAYTCRCRGMYDSIDDRPYRLLTARARTNKSSLCDYLIWEYATDTVLQ